jgi:hypothetical protein
LTEMACADAVPGLRMAGCRLEGCRRRFFEWAPLDRSVRIVQDHFKLILQAKIAECIHVDLPRRDASRPIHEIGLFNRIFTPALPDCRAAAEGFCSGAYMRASERTERADAVMTQLGIMDRPALLSNPVLQSSFRADRMAIRTPALHRLRGRRLMRAYCALIKHGRLGMRDLKSPR